VISRLKEAKLKEIETENDGNAVLSIGGYCGSKGRQIQEKRHPLAIMYKESRRNLLRNFVTYMVLLSENRKVKIQF
jgi:hypothetical protein